MDIHVVRAGKKVVEEFERSKIKRGNSKGNCNIKRLWYFNIDRRARSRFLK